MLVSAVGRCRGDRFSVAFGVYRKQGVAVGIPPSYLDLLDKAISDFGFRISDLRDVCPG